MSDTMYTAGVIAIIAVVTWFTRALPHLVFGGKKETPKAIGYLSTYLPSAIIIILVFYCIRNTAFFVYPYGMAEIISIAAVVVIQYIGKNMLISIPLGTVLYMVLIRTVFKI